jgi:hypothetical protein
MRYYMVCGQYDSAGHALEALVIGNKLNLIWSMPYLLWRAGFAVDVVATHPAMRLSRFVREVHIVEAAAEYACGLVRTRRKPYDWVIVGDDNTLADFAAIEARSGRTTGCLPLTAAASREQIFSKIGLSRLLAAKGIRTPAFRSAGNGAEAVAAAREIGYPVLLKIDASGGGVGMHECANDGAILALRLPFERPLLVQKKIAGKEIDLSALYLDGELVHFSYAGIEATTSRFGPSSLRTYRPLSLVPPAVFDEMAALGHALGASGFVNISAIEAVDGSGRYFFEADLRPNVWVDYPAFFGEDVAARIRAWFRERIPLCPENAVSPQTQPLLLPYFLRLGHFELLCGRYGVWKYIPFADARLVRRLLMLKALSLLLKLGKMFIPTAQRDKVRTRLARHGLVAT